MRTHGHPVPRGETVGELAARTEAADPAVAASLLELKPLVDTALFSPYEPGDDVVEAAWAAEANVGRSVGQTSTIPRRVRAAVDPRPIVDHLRKR